MTTKTTRREWMKVGTVCVATVATTAGWFQEDVTADDGNPVDGVGELTAMARRSIERHGTILRPLEIAMNREWWMANVTGADDAYARKAASETAVSVAYSDREEFERLRQLLKDKIFSGFATSDKAEQRRLHRQITLLYNAHLPQQVSPEQIEACCAVANRIERMFNTYRPQIGGEATVESVCRRMLLTETDSAKLRGAWEALKGACPAIEPSFIELVKLRNDSARSVGFRDFHQMSLAANEQDQDDVLSLFDQLDRLTRRVYQAEKAELDVFLARRFGVELRELRPWHYMDPFFQEVPPVYDPDFDAESAYRGIDIESICRKFYADMGIGIDDVLDRSDLYERAGKNPNGFAMDVDRAGDVRILCNIVGSSQWLATTLHELGHAAYMSTHIPDSLPYLLRMESHPLTTEGIAMLMERSARDADSMRKMGLAIPDPVRFRAASTKLNRMRSLLFTRWTQVMLRFEREAYADPDQDLATLWWDLVEEYQEVRRPDDWHSPDYLAKLHFYQAPCYYHNYQMGELFASQILRKMLGEIQPDVRFGPTGKGAGDVSLISRLLGNRDVGAWLQRNVFDFGRIGDYHALCHYATGENLSADAFAAEFVETD